MPLIRVELFDYRMSDGEFLLLLLADAYMRDPRFSDKRRREFWNRVSDHRIGLTLHRLDAVMEGDLDEIIEALTTHFQTERLKRELVA